ncbi:hypothetical protein K1719_012170 [Acacia pycnantha]|nr:hypothetical protein K1719_012170 [Acacia pycnantha]
MGTLLKCYRPFFLMLPSSARTIHPTIIFRRKKLGSVTHCFSASFLRSSQPSITEQSFEKSNGERVRNPSSELWLYNTMSKERELFKPKVEVKVGMYVCGVITYILAILDMLASMSTLTFFTDILSIWNLKSLMFVILLT